MHLQNTLVPEFREHCRRGVEISYESDDTCYEIVSSIYDREAVPMTSQQYYTLNEVSALPTPVNVDRENSQFSFLDGML